MVISAHLQEMEKQQRERNTRLLAKILDSLTSITYRTSWVDVSICMLLVSSV